MAVPVKTYFERYVGLPQLDDNWGDLTKMLDAVLVNGFNPKVITSLTRVDQVVTAQCVAHGYDVDQCVTISDADQPEYNGEFLVTNRSADWFSFVITGSPVSPATTATAFNAIASPLGFEILFSDTNRRCYRSKDAASNRRVLIVDDSLPPGYNTTYAKYGRVAIAENMTDAYTIVGSQAPFDSTNPTKSFGVTGSGVAMYAGWYKWYYASSSLTSSGLAVAALAGSRHFTIVGDDKAFWFFVQSTNPSFNWHPIKAVYAFGEWPSFRAADPYNTVLIAHEMWLPANTSLYTAYYNYFATNGDDAGKLTLRDFTGASASQKFSALSMSILTGQVSGYAHTAIYTVPYPNGPNGSLVVYPVYQRETTSGFVRGTYPGMYFNMHPHPLSDRSYVDNMPGLPGRKLMCVETSHSSNNGTGTNTNPRVFVDVTGPWR